MSAGSDCINDMQTAIGRKLHDSEIEAIAQAVQVRMAKAKADGLSAREAAAKVGKEITAEQAKAAMIARYDAANNILKFADLRLRTIEGKEVQAGRSVLSGYAAGNTRNSAMSVDAAHHTLRGNLLAPAVRDLEAAGLLKAMQGRDKAFDARVAQELRRRGNPDLEKPTGDKRAEQAAHILGNVVDAGRAMMNKEGAFIGNIEGYMGRQYHDMWKVRGDGSDAAYKVWRDEMVQRRDMEADFKDLTPEQTESNLRASWRGLSSGVHDTSSNPGGFQGGANLGKKVSQERTITFKSAADWTAYNEKFGKGGVMDAIFSGADGAARDTALMQMFGTNPKAMWDRWQSDMLDKAVGRQDFKAADNIRAGKNDGLFDLITGRGNIPGNMTLATIGATVRQSMQLIHLGSIVFSALSHIPINAELMRHNGSNFWEGLGNQIRAMVPQGKESREVALSIHAGIDGMMGHIIQRFRTEDGVPGKMAEAVNQFHKWSGFAYYMDGQKAGIGLGISHSMAQNAGKEFEALDARMQTTLRRYGIEKGEWDIGRASAQKAADGRNYLIPAHIGDDAVGQKFQTLITDQTREGMNEPTPYARLQATGGTKAGTAFGEIVRAVMQFKSFALSMMERQAGRLSRNGVDIPGAFYLIGGMTLAGYAAMTLRDLASNKTPRKPQDAAGWAALVRDAMVAGGGVGLYGDVLLRGGERSGADILKGLAGPAPATALDALYGAKHVMEGGTGDRKGIALKEGQKVLSDLTPNHVFLKAANDFLLGHMFREMVSPGATRRYNNLLHEKGQTQILRPALQN